MANSVKGQCPLQAWMDKHDLSVADVMRITQQKADSLSLGDKGGLGQHTVYRVLNGERPMSHLQAVVCELIDPELMGPRKWLPWFRDLHDRKHSQVIAEQVAQRLGIEVTAVASHEVGRILQAALLDDMDADQLREDYREHYQAIRENLGP